MSQEISNDMAEAEVLSSRAKAALTSLEDNLCIFEDMAQIQSPKEAPLSTSSQQVTIEDINLLQQRNNNCLNRLNVLDSLINSNNDEKYSNDSSTLSLVNLNINLQQLHKHKEDIQQLKQLQENISSNISIIQLLLNLPVKSIIKEGWLTKRGNVRKNWNRRWFVLTNDGILKYYKTIKKSKLLNEIDLLYCKGIGLSTDHDRRSYAWIITLTIPGREFIVSCESENERKSWFSVLQTCMQYCKKNNNNNNSNNNNNNNNNNSINNNSNNEIKENKEEIFYMNLSKIEWEQIQDNNTFADLQEELEDIARLELNPPDRLKIISYPNASRTKNDQDWNSITQKVHDYFAKKHGNVIMQGWLKKRMQWTKEWKERWCVLTKYNCIEYYKNKNSELKGSLELSGVISVKKIDNDTEANVFEVETTKRSIKFACASSEEMFEWIDALQKHSIYRARHSDVSDSDPDIGSPSNEKERIDPVIC